MAEQQLDHHHLALVRVRVGVRVRVRVTVTVTARAKVRVRIAPRLPRYAGGTTGPRDWYACPVRAVRGALGASGPAPLVRTVRRGLVRVARTGTVRRPRRVR